LLRSVTRRVTGDDVGELVIARTSSLRIKPLPPGRMSGGDEAFWASMLPPLSTTTRSRSRSACVTSACIKTPLLAFDGLGLEGSFGAVHATSSAWWWAAEHASIRSRGVTFP